MSDRRLGGVLLLSGGAVNAVLNFLLPTADAENEFLGKIATSDTWPFLHAGLIVGVIVSVIGLMIFLRTLSTRRPWSDVAIGALIGGGTVLLTALAVSGTTLRHRAEVWYSTGDSASDPFNIPTYLDAETIDNLAFALYGVSDVLVFGLVPLAIAFLLRGTRSYPGWLTWWSGLVGLAGLGLGFVQLTADLDMGTAALVISSIVILWTLTLGALMLQKDQPAA